MTTYKIGSFAGNEIRVQGHGVEKVHAHIYQDEDGDVIIEDKKSAGGTFVNNVRIKRFRIKSTDRVRLGKVPFDLSGNLVFSNGSVTGIRKPNDFSKDFQLLKDVWDEYSTRTLDLGKSSGKQQRMRQIFSSLGSLGLILGIAIPSLPPILRVGLMAVGTLAAIYFVFVSTSGKSMTKKQDDKNALQLALTESYVCPKCKSPLPKEPFEILIQRKKHNCGALWI